MPKVPVTRQSSGTGARGPSVPRILLDDTPGGLKASNSRVLGVGVEDSGTGDVGTVDGQSDGGLTGAQRGDGRDAHNCLGMSPMSVSRALGAGGPRPSLVLLHPCGSLSTPSPTLAGPYPPHKLALAISHSHRDPAASIQRASGDGEPRTPRSWAPTGTYTVKRWGLWEKQP